MFLYFSFILDSSPLLLAFSSTPLPSDTDLCRSLQPCARAVAPRRTIHFRHFSYSPVPFSHTTPRGLSPAGLDFDLSSSVSPTRSFHRVVYIVFRYLGLVIYIPKLSLSHDSLTTDSPRSPPPSTNTASGSEDNNSRTPPPLSLGAFSFSGAQLGFLFLHSFSELSRGRLVCHLGHRNQVEAISPSYHNTCAID